MNRSEITVFAETNFRNEYRKFGIKRDDRRRHMYLIGKTGMGKSTIQENMIIEDIRAGHGVAVVDPHGDLAEKIIEYIPNDRINDVVYFNPADYDYPIAFNVVDQVEPHLRHLVASGLIGVFRKLWADSWGPRLEYILRNTILAILDYPGSTLLAVTRMLADKPFRKKVIEKIQDPVVKSFWVNEFAGYNDKFASEAISPIQNKVGQFLSTSLIRNIVGQVKSTIDMRDIMDQGKILIINLSKGRIGEDNSALLGAMMITKLQLAAMSRVNIPENERKDFYLYVDEFQNIVTDSFADILSEARKYHLCLILAHQYITQLPEKVADAVFGNVGTLVVFRVGATDAEALVPEFTPVFTEEDIVNLPKYEFYLKLMIDGVASTPFSAKGLRPLTKEELTGNTEKVIAVSRERYAKQRAVVEEKILRWHENEPEKKPERAEAARDVRAGQDFQRPVFSQNRPPQNAPTRLEYPREGNERRQAPSVSREIEPRTQTEKMPDMSGPVQAAASSTPRFGRDNERTAAIPPTMPARPVPEKRNDGGNEVPCSRCQKTTKVFFKPDGVRPIYCKDCLSLIKEEKRKEIEDRKRRKESELRHLQEVEKPVLAVAPISLESALKTGPVNFAGKKITPVEPRKERIDDDRPVTAPNPPEEIIPQAATIPAPAEAEERGEEMDIEEES